FVARFQGLQAEQVFPLGREGLHAVVGGADPDAVPAVHGDADGTRQVLGPAAEAARVGTVAAECQQRLALGSEFLHAAQLAFGGVDVARAVEGEEVRAAGAALRVLDAVELPRLAAVFSPPGQELAFGREDLHAAIDLVGDIDLTVGADGDAAGLVELAVA